MTATRSVPRSTSRSDRVAPVVAGLMALLLGLLILPSVLRPPQDQPQTSSAFSPDAPPDPNQPSVFQSFNSARSGTAAGIEAIPTTTTTAPPRKRGASACPYGFGDPPRQIESVYAPPCAPAFTGDNGGATSFGITADAINVCFLAELTGTVQSDGEMAGPVAPNDSANMRTYKVLRDYFNSRYQLYGRRLRFFYPTNDSSKEGDAQSRARADKARDVNKCFAALQETKPAESDQLAKRQIIHFTQAQTPEKWFGDHDPYIWSFTPSGSQGIRLGSEYACKKLVGKPPVYADGPRFAGATQRKFGAIVYTLPAYDNPGPALKARMKACGVDLDPIVTYSLTAEGADNLASAITTMQSANVTTIMYLGDLISAVPFTQTAKLNRYFPEWFIPGFGGVDTGHIARQYDQDVWSNAFGFSFYEIPKPDTETECYKAYHEIDPSNDPDNGMCTYLWDDMVQLFGAMQQAGPKLTIESMKQAFVNQKKLPPDPPWAMAGGYELNDHTFPDWAAEIWWDRNAIGSDGQRGTYRYVRGGKRYTYEQWPSEDPDVFTDKPSSITLNPT